MLSPPDSFGESTTFSGYPAAAFVHSFVQTDILTMISHERLEQFL